MGGGREANGGLSGGDEAMVEGLHSDGVVLLKYLKGQDELGSHVDNFVDPIGCQLWVNRMLGGRIDWSFDRMQTSRAGGLATLSLSFFFGMSR